MSLSQPAVAPAVAATIACPAPARPRRRRTVVPLHGQPTIAHGGLAGRTTRSSGRYVAATTVDGRPVWIDATTVWVDAELDRPRIPVPHGLATAVGNAQLAVLAGLCDRLGHEAAIGDLETMAEAPLAPRCPGRLLDGRLGHQIPTVVAVDDGGLRWGAGATWEAAHNRARFGEGWPGAEGELEQLLGALDREGLAVAVVDLGSSVLAAANVHRCSVQLTRRDTRGR